MRYACYVITALLAIALAATVGIGRAAEGEPAAAVEETLEAPVEPTAALPVDPDEMLKSVVERLAQARAEWLARVRVALGVESDDDWATMEPLIGRLEQLGRIRDFMRQKGQVLAYAQGLSGDELMTGAERMQAQFASFNPDLLEEDIKELVAAHTGLAGAFYNKDATEEQVAEALRAWGQATAELYAKLDHGGAELARVATARQQAGLMLMGILDAPAASPAP